MFCIWFEQLRCLLTDSFWSPLKTLFRSISQQQMWCQSTDHSHLDLALSPGQIVSLKQTDLSGLMIAHSLVLNDINEEPGHLDGTQNSQHHRFLFENVLLKMKAWILETHVFILLNCRLLVGKQQERSDWNHLKKQDMFAACHPPATQPHTCPNLTFSLLANHLIPSSISFIPIVSFGSTEGEVHRGNM